MARAAHGDREYTQRREEWWIPNLERPRVSSTRQRTSPRVLAEQHGCAIERDGVADVEEPVDARAALDENVVGHRSARTVARRPKRATAIGLSAALEPSCQAA